MLNTSEIIEEIVHIPAQAIHGRWPGRSQKIQFLEGILTYRDDIESGPVALLPGPHPNFAGSMDNNVVSALAKGMAEEGWITLKFNYPGVGRSDLNLQWVAKQGIAASSWEYWNYVEKNGAFELAENSLYSAHQFLKARVGVPAEKISWIGYSFGALIALRLATSDICSKRAGLHPSSIVAIATPWLAKHDFTFLDKLSIPTSIISGDEDFALDQATLTEATNRIRDPFLAPIRMLPGHDHFFRGEEAIIKNEVLNAFMAINK